MTIRRQSKLLNYKANNSGNLELRSEFDTGLEVDDVVFIVGSSNLDIFTDAHLAAFDPYSTYSNGYTVLSVNTSNNSIVLDYPYSSGITIGEDAHISNTYVSSGHISYGSVYSVCVGENGSDNKVLFGNTVMPPVYGSIYNTPMNTGYVNWLGGTFKAGRWSDLSMSNVTTIKYELSAGTPVPVTVGINNDGYGYSWFRDGIFGNSDLTQPVKFANGIMYNGTWVSGTMSAGLLSGESGRITVDAIELYDGTTIGVIFNGCNIYGGVHYGALDLMPINIAFDTFPSPTSIEIQMDSATTAALFDNGDTVTIHISKLPIIVMPPVTSVFTGIDHENHVYGTVLSVVGDIVEISIPDWLDTSVAFPFTMGRTRVTKGVILSGYITSSTLYRSTLLGSTPSDVIATSSNLHSVLIGSAIVDNCGQNGNSDEQSKMVDGLLYNTSMTRMDVRGGRVVGGIMLESDFNGGIWEGNIFRLSNLRNAENQALYVSGTFIDSFRDANTPWEEFTYSSGVWTGYTGPAGVVTNTSLVYTDWYPTAAPGLLPYTLATPDYGIWNSIIGPYNVGLSYYSPDAATALGVQVIDDITSDIYTERVIVSSALKALIDNTNTQIQLPAPLPNDPNDISLTGKSISASGASRVRYIKYDSAAIDPTSYTIESRIKIGVTEYSPGSVVIGTPNPGTLRLNIDVSPGGTTQWPDDAIKINNVIVTIVPGIPTNYPTPPGTVSQYIPNLGGGSPTSWGGAASYDVIDTTISSVINILCTPSTTVMVMINYEYKLTAGGSYTPGVINDSFVIT